MAVGGAACLLASDQHEALRSLCRDVLIAGVIVFAVFSPFAVDYLWSARTVYALTSRRAIIWYPCGIVRLGFSSHPLSELGPFVVRSAHGGHDVVLREREEEAGEAGHITVRTSFRDVRNAEHVRRLAIATQRRSEGRE
jgi:hypothetical protein